MEERGYVRVCVCVYLLLTSNNKYSLLLFLILFVLVPFFLFFFFSLLYINMLIVHRAFVFFCLFDHSSSFSFLSLRFFTYFHAL